MHSNSFLDRLITIRSPYLLFLRDVTELGYAKTAFGLRDWAGHKCLGELRLPLGTVSTGLPALSAREAHAIGARSLVVGLAPAGGAIKSEWIPYLIGALEAGLDLVNCLHMRLTYNPILYEAANRLGRRLIDVRIPPTQLAVGTGLKRTGNRLLTVGTDCALGKKYTDLAITRALASRGFAWDFRATGQLAS